LPASGYLTISGLYELTQIVNVIIDNIFDNKKAVAATVLLVSRIAATLDRASSVAGAFGEGFTMSPEQSG
jgi:hypothetical protein